MKLRKHALKQAQRRAIKTELLELVVSYGEEFKVGGGRRIFRIPRAEIGFLKAECAPMLWRRYRDRLGQVVPVVAEDQEIITAMHRYRPLWKRGRY